MKDYKELLEGKSIVIGKKYKISGFDPSKNKSSEEDVIVVNYIKSPGSKPIVIIKRLKDGKEFKLADTVFKANIK